MKVLVVMNPGSGAIQRQGADASRARIESAFAAHGIAATIFPGSPAEIAARLGSAAHPTGPSPTFDAVAVAGGDGTVNTAADKLAGTGMPLAVLPFGTFNHFARDLGIPLDIDEAVGVIAGKNMQKVDVGEVNGRVFVNNSSLGMYPDIVAERSRERRRGLSKWAAIPLALVRVLWRLPAPRMHVAAEEWATALETPCLFVGNNFYDLNAFPLAERARLDGGELCVYAVARKSRLALFGLGCRIVLGRLEPGQDLLAARACEVRVTTRQRRMRVALDGNFIVLTAPLHYRVRPAALAVFAPLRQR
jgi:diacylglycerol kinase family enzyme